MCDSRQSLYDQHENGLIESSNSRRQQESLQRHIASHLLSLALISVPPMGVADGDSSDLDHEKSSRAALDTTREHLESLEHLQSFDASYADDTAIRESQPLNEEGSVDKIDSPLGARVTEAAPSLPIHDETEIS